jgi:glycosyltransferase involved in cell wall biosynthesis
VLIEAMASGLPCVAIDRNGPTEVVRDGETGFLVPPREAAFAESARLLAERPHIRQAMGRRAQEWSHAQFGFDTALSLERAYEIARERFLAAGSSGRPHVFGGRRFARPKAKSSW